nr:TorF family putative porin [Gammaproteobacteria bacterium]
MTSYRKRLAVSALGGLLAAPPMAGAVEVLGGDLSANIGVVSNYYFRGVTQTDDKAAVQGGLDWVHGTGIYVGTW